MAGTIPREPITTYVVLKVMHRFPITGGVGQECARRLWSRDEVVDVVALVDAPTLSDVYAKLEALP